MNGRNVATGHLHPPFLKIMDDIQEGLRYTFQTDSKYTLLVTGTGECTVWSVSSPALVSISCAVTQDVTWAQPHGTSMCRSQRYGDLRRQPAGARRKGRRW